MEIKDEFLPTIMLLVKNEILETNSETETGKQYIKILDEIYESIIEYLGLKVGDKVELKKINERRGHKIKWVSVLTQRPPRILSGPVKWIKKILGIKRVGILDLLRNKNLTTKPREKLSLDLQKEIINHYRDDILKLSRLTGRDLNHWLEV